MVESNKTIVALDCKHKTSLHLINEKLAGGKLDSPATKKTNDKLKTNLNKTADNISHAPVWCNHNIIKIPLRISLQGLM